MFDSLGSTIYRHRWLTLALAGAFLALSVALLLRGGELTGGNIAGLESGHAEQLAESVTGRPAETTFIAIFRSKRLEPDSTAFQQAMRKALAPLRSDARVLAVTAPADAPPAIAAGMRSPRAHSALALISLRGTAKQALHAYPEVRQKLRSHALEITCTGRIPFLHDLGITLEKDLHRAELVSLPLALLVLLLVFRSVVAAALPVGVGALAVVGGIAIVVSLSHYTDIAAYTINVCSLVGLGVAIDYSLFTVARYREELHHGHDYEEALRRAMAASGRIVTFSGLAVATGLSGLMFFHGSYLLALGVGGAIVVALAVVFALTFLPALLAVLGPKIDAGRLPLPARAEGRGFWHALAIRVMRRPVMVLLPTLAVLLMMGVPFLHLEMAAADVRVLPAGTEARGGYDALVRDFPAQADTRVLVAVHFPSAPALTRPRVGALFDLSRRIAKIPHVRRVESVVDGPPLPKQIYEQMLVDPPPGTPDALISARRMSVGRQVVLLYALTDAGPDSEAARDVVRAIRSQRSVADGRLEVGGQTANDMDATAFIVERAPHAIAFVVAVMLVVLFWLLGSVLLPIKAVLMNFVSISGAFGALVWVFQDGHLFIQHPHPLEPSLPVILFCTLFGLSMDYEVLMLSRMKEAFEVDGNNTQAVADGLERSAGLITSAAAIMVAVFLAFALARVVMIQAVGFGMAVAVVLDATLVRVLLVPSTMRLLGRLNWWAPAPLLRLRSRLGGGVRH